MIFKTLENSETHFTIWYNNRGIGDIYKEVDGFYVFIFDTSKPITGCFSEEFFRYVAKKLNGLNKDWNNIIEGIQ